MNEKLLKMAYSDDLEMVTLAVTYILTNYEDGKEFLNKDFRAVISVSQILIFYYNDKDIFVYITDHGCNFFRHLPITATNINIYKNSSLYSHLPFIYIPYVKQKRKKVQKIPTSQKKTE